MIKVLADSPRDAALIKAAAGGTARVVNGASRFVTDDGPVECLILGCRSRHLPERVGLLREIEREWPRIPVIVVTDPMVDRRSSHVRYRDTDAEHR